MKVLDYLEKNGCYGRVVAVEHLKELKEEIKSLHREGKLDDDFYDEWMPSYLDHKPPKNFSQAKSIFVVSTPVPAGRITFHWKGRARKIIVPPTYGRHQVATSRARRLIKEGFEPDSYWLAQAVLPLKLLAVRSGLAMYGKNNITYVPKYGSFHRLTAFYSDFDSPEDHWQEKKPLPKCGRCKACLRNCPTGAICDDRFLIHVERCLTLLNEKSRDHPFPSWIKPDMHNTIVGCMRCQKVCPYDKDVIDWIEDRGEFSEEETAYLLKGRYSGQKKAAIEKKLKASGVDLSILPRNLEVLLRRDA